MGYKKTQVGWVIVAIFALLTIVLILAYVNQWGNNPLPYVPFIVTALLFAVVLLLFYKLTIEIDGSMLKLIYGIGLIRIRFRIDKLERVEVIKTPWYYGLGIRITPKGMLYNIQGLKAVRIEYLRDGKRKKVMIGSAEPEKLKEALEGNFAEIV